MDDILKNLFEDLKACSDEELNNLRAACFTTLLKQGAQPADLLMLCAIIMRQDEMISLKALDSSLKSVFKV